MDDEVKCEPGAPGWVVTFGDMMSLLLTFFILLLSFAKLEKSKFKQYALDMKKAFGVDNVTPRQTFEDGRSPAMQHYSLPFNATDVMKKMKEIVEQQQTRSPAGKVDIKVDQNQQGVLMTIPYESMFESGSADIKSEVWPMLDDVAKKLKYNSAQVKVMAFTDNIPIKTKEFSSNDHLSASRSVALIKYLMSTSERLPAERFESVPFGPNRPITSNMSERSRRRNRRIEVQFYSRPSAEWKSVQQGVE
jgi:chemotaxis protein MotB